MLPARSHGLLLDPLDSSQAIAVARRPGEYILRFNVRSLRTTILREPEFDRVFEGHAAFSADGQTLYSSESDRDSGQGLVGVRDSVTLAKRGEFATHGIGPHALLVDDDGSLLVANGGILTLPETGRIKRNIERMDPSLVRLAAADGQLLGQWRLPTRNSAFVILPAAKTAPWGLPCRPSMASRRGGQAPACSLFSTAPPSIWELSAKEATSAATAAMLPACPCPKAPGSR
jgi:hypothetical protein